MELLAVCFISPSLTAGAISSEREHQTYDLLRTSLLSARSLVLGKLISAIAFVLLIIIASIPLQSIALIFGGITPAEVLIGSLILILTAITVGALGLFFSSITRSTRTSTVLAQATTLIVIFGTPIFLLLLISVFDFQISPSQLNPFGEALVAVFGWFMLISNPLSTSIVSEIILLEEQSLYYFEIPLSNGGDLPMISPWLGFVILYPILTFLFISFTTNLIKQADQ